MEQRHFSRIKNAQVLQYVTEQTKIRQPDVQLNTSTMVRFVTSTMVRLVTSAMVRLVISTMVRFVTSTMARFVTSTLVRFVTSTMVRFVTDLKQLGPKFGEGMSHYVYRTLFANNSVVDARINNRQTHKLSPQSQQQLTLLTSQHLTIFTLNHAI